MSRSELLRWGAGVLVVLASTVIGAWMPRASGPPQVRRIEVKARQYAYDPPTIEVNQGDTVRLKLTSQDVVHGFYLEAYDLQATIMPQSPYVEVSRPSRPEEKPEKLEEVEFVADRTGKFRYRCSHTCGTMHPFMSGELVVKPNRLLGGGVGAFAGMLIAGCLLACVLGNGSGEAAVANSGRSPHAIP
ncbi:MAG: hypothetical protein HYY18_22605 [Planctomycetes bacterium]|nr:hypothetical protein [Planctomycetota bacterium]